MQRVALVPQPGSPFRVRRVDRNIPDRPCLDHAWAVERPTTVRKPAFMPTRATHADSPPPARQGPTRRGAVSRITARSSRVPFRSR